ncbi:hypothetical protein KSF_084300 [Reticulibacter mediterranei]|uniref:HTH cro/C1-type domain-containing protein n=2 Tax=Reticulibacter mediterranei TaxID=2778369 RepID=A0A8J3IX21_9CHLR|nr:hypothetical protein KSF_084300 [Reticulibacter mediterranei]
MTRYRLAQLTQIDFKNIDLIYKNPRKPVETETLGKIATVLGITDPNELLEIVLDEH